MDSEKALRTTLLTASVILWAGSITVSWLVIGKHIDSVQHPGIGLIVFIAQGLAITLTIIWAQFRSRRIMIEVMKAGVAAGRGEEDMAVNHLKQL